MRELKDEELESIVGGGEFVPLLVDALAVAFRRWWNGVSRLLRRR